jgi:PBSX family phage terminase large subunit
MGSGVNLAALSKRLKIIEKRRPTDDNWPDQKVELRGANLEIQTDTSKEVLIVGSAGTGKTTACLKKIYDICLNNPQVRVALVRKTRASLVETALVTFEQHILGYNHPLMNGASRPSRTSYVFPNGSRINVVGMDKPDRILSADYDIIYVCQAEEITESDAEALMSRLRNGKFKYHQLLMDCNPQSESHWLWQRHIKGALKLLTSYHQDNPKFYDDKKNDWTEEGRNYLEMLGALTGVRYKRLFLGQWVSAEGAVYDFERNRHVFNGEPPRMKRYITGVDWGHRDAGAMVTIGEGMDDKLYVVEEHVATGKTLDYWKNLAHHLMDTYGSHQFNCDPSLMAHIQAFALDGIPAVRAMNKIQFGVDLVKQRFSTDRLLILSSSIKIVDSTLREKRMPIGLIEEIEGYVWNEKKDMPKDNNNHAVDALRYAVVAFDRPMSNVKPFTSQSTKQFKNMQMPQAMRKVRYVNR